MCEDGSLLLQQIPEINQFIERKSLLCPTVFRLQSMAVGTVALGLLGHMSKVCDKVKESIL